MLICDFMCKLYRYIHPNITIHCSANKKHAYLLFRNNNLIIFVLQNSSKQNFLKIGRAHV